MSFESKLVSRSWTGRGWSGANWMWLGTVVIPGRKAELCWEDEEVDECSQDSSDVAVEAYVRLGERF